MIWVDLNILAEVQIFPKNQVQSNLVGSSGSIVSQIRHQFFSIEQENCWVETKMFLARVPECIFVFNEMHFTDRLGGIQKLKVKI